MKFVVTNNRTLFASSHRDTDGQHLVDRKLFVVDAEDDDDDDHDDDCVSRELNECVKKH
jgi:hypothetical protein